MVRNGSSVKLTEFEGIVSCSVICITFYLSDLLTMGGVREVVTLSMFLSRNCRDHLTLECRRTNQRKTSRIRVVSSVTTVGTTYV